MGLPMKSTTGAPHNSARSTQRTTRNDKRNQQSRLHKQQKKRRGSPPGSRNQVDMTSVKKTVSATAQSDPRIGSKKPVPLLIERQLATDKPTAKPSSTAESRQALIALENHPRLHALLDKQETGDQLTVKELAWLDSTLAQIEHYMKALGMTLDEPEEDGGHEEKKGEDMLQLLRGH